MSGVTTLPECEQLCPNCERSGYENNAWCQNCGYYAVLGRCIEIDHVWEEQCRDADDAAESAPQPSLLSGILMIPGWMWQLFALILLLTAFAVLFHLGVAEGSASRIVGAVAIVLVSGITLAAAHVYAGVQVAREDIDFQPMDILMRPLRLWVTALSRLPRNFKCTAFATGSLWTLLVVHLIVGVPYSQLQDLSAPSKRPGVPNAMLSLNAGGSEDMTLEEAMEAFTDAAVKTGQDEDEEEPALTLEQAIKELWEGLSADEDASDIENQPVEIQLQASIIGYATDDQDAVQSVVVAVRSKGSWRVAGSVSDGIDPELAQQLLTQLEPIQRERPFLENEYEATWVEPIVGCTIAARYSKADDRFESLTLVELR